MTATNSSSLTNSVAVVTGASRGIGLAIARILSDMGATVVMTGRSHEALDRAAAEIEGSGKIHKVACDLADLKAVESLGRELKERYGHVGILVNNAGIGGTSTFLHELSPDEWDAIFNTNVRGVYYMVRAVAPLMLLKGGHIINISSLAGKNALPRGAAYSASKWALNGLSYSLAEELRGQNIRVSVICPGSVDTSFSPRRGAKDASKMLQPEDVAHAVQAIVTQEPQSFMSEILLRPTQKP